MEQRIIDKVAACKELQGKSIADILSLPEFEENLEKYLKAQRGDRLAARKSYASLSKLHKIRGISMKLPAHPVDKFMDMPVEEFAVEYYRCIIGKSSRSAAERKFIEQLAGQAYALTTAQIVCREFPELTDELIPKNK